MEPFRVLPSVVRKVTYFVFILRIAEAIPTLYTFMAFILQKWMALLPFIRGRSLLMSLKQSHMEYKFTTVMYYHLRIIFIRVCMGILSLTPLHQEKKLTN